MARKRLVNLYKDDKRNYEICYIVDQRLSEDALKKLNESIKIDIEKYDGVKVVEQSVTKLLTFSYLIGSNHSKGYYVCCYVQSHPEYIKKIQTKLSMETGVLRVLIRIANPKKQSYGIFSPQYNTDGYKNKNRFFSYDDPNVLFKYLSEGARIAPRKITLNKKISKNSAKNQRSVARVIKTARAFALIPYTED